MARKIRLFLFGIDEFFRPAVCFVLSEIRNESG